MRKSNSTNFNSSKQSKRRTEKGLDKELWKMQLTTSTSKKDDNGTNRAPNETTEVSSTSSRGIESCVRNVPNTAYKWKSKRPIVVKRRFSPTHESSTSDSQRSSNQSCRSPPRNDSLGKYYKLR
ncbi:hypothetical protein DICVIV_11025 [Dictyocaulus viviparus]|uniref:Uncharacterized protein n=1 Tax=Dictyocaulus viviparus TaxID=29172 RepID=A0A0D8XE97_DICVI|nr:hypothetical protein DICVIV_11025 [Dictyocaulus viviparus]